MRMNLVQLALLATLFGVLVIWSWVILFALVSTGMAYTTGVVLGAVSLIIAVLVFYFLAK